MKLKLALAAGAALLAVSAFSTASAQEANVYINGGYSNFDGNGSNLGAVTGRVGVGFGPNLGIEGEASFGVKKDSGVKLDNEFGFYGVGKLPLSPQFDLFARVGWSRIETSPGGDSDGAAYGVGGDYYFTSADGVRLDYTRHDYDPGNVDQVSLSYVRKF